MNRRVLGVPSATGQLRGTNDFDNVALVGDDEELVSGEVVLVGGDVALMGGDVALVGDGVSWWVVMWQWRLRGCIYVRLGAAVGLRLCSWRVREMDPPCLQRYSTGSAKRALLAGYTSWLLAG